MGMEFRATGYETRPSTSQDAGAQGSSGSVPSDLFKEPVQTGVTLSSHPSLRKAQIFFGKSGFHTVSVVKRGKYAEGCS